MFIDTELEKSFGDFGALIGAWSEEKPDARALADSISELTWREVAQATARIAVQLQRDGLQRGQAVAILGTSHMRWCILPLCAQAAVLRH
jgi:acyl-CoA synthetase (AMP-forming)/AMP-acid ligase II